MARHTLRPATAGGRPALGCAGLPGVRVPETLIGIGENYWPAGTGARTPSRVPLVFGKFAGSVVPSGAEILVPEGADVVCEGELAVVVGRTAKDLDGPDAALRCLAGVTVANDVSARDLQAADVQSTRGKSLDTFCPLGPELVTLDDVGNLDDLVVVTRVDGRVVQRSSTARMVFGVAELVVFCSRFMTLYPGDVILTGTPAEQRDEDLRIRPGQTVEVEIDGVGLLTNPVRAAHPGPSRR